jgi:peptidoglycan hydrolase-like protein with peptidoglycan-binding domain
LAYINFGSRVLERGVSGTDVEILQYLLNNLPRTISSSISEGGFGPQTEASVRKFQEYFGLTADGIVGPVTFLFLGQPTDPYLPADAMVFGSRTLSRGSSGRDVWVLQNRLASTAKKYAQALGRPADGQFGTRTRAAVRLFQQDRGLTQDGVVGPQTLVEVFRHTHMGGRYLQRNRFERNQGYDVYFLQVHLRELGFSSGATDGKFGPATQAAVRSLQRSAGIRADGLVGPQTYYHLAYS